MAVDKEILWWRIDEYSGADKVTYLLGLDPAHVRESTKQEGTTKAALTETSRSI
jgi:hypothetical protein